METLLFVGEHYECCVRLGNGQLATLHLPRSTELAEGAAVRLKVPEKAISVWPR